MATEKRLIDANELLEWLCDGCSPRQQKMCDNDPVCGTKIRVMESPTVDAVEVVHGRWDKNWDGDNIIYCNQCYMPQDEPTPYCHSCGAKMDGDGNG